MSQFEQTAKITEVAEFGTEASHQPSFTLGVHTVSFHSNTTSGINLSMIARLLEIDK